MKVYNTEEIINEENNRYFFISGQWRKKVFFKLWTLEGWFNCCIVSETIPNNKDIAKWQNYDDALIINIFEFKDKKEFYGYGLD